MKALNFPFISSGQGAVSSDVFIIAEIGKNFIQSEDDRSVSEYLNNAKELVDKAVEAGCDAVKFQTHEVEDEVLNIDFTSPHFKGADRYTWVVRNMNATPLEDFWKPLKQYCDEKGIIFFSTPMSRKAAQKLEKLNVPMWKVGSGDVQDHVLLDYIIETGKPIIISSGMVGLAELDEVISYIKSHNAPLSTLYCISQYPCSKEHFNLGTIEYLKEKYPSMPIGFSDHSVGSFEVDLAAVKLGARIIEKHFSISRELWGSDHKVSMTPTEMKDMVQAIRNDAYKDIDVSKYYGDKGKELEGVSNEFRPYFNKALVAGCDIKVGDVVTKDMVYAMRPFMHIKGLPANKVHEVIGKKINKNLKKFDPLTEDLFEAV